ATSVGVSAYTFGSLYPPDTLTLLSPRYAPPPPPPDHPDAIAHAQAIEDQLHSLPLLKKLRSAPDADDWYETRPYTSVPEHLRVHHLTSGALRAPGRLAVAPLVRAKKDESENVIIIHIGRGLCSHDGIVHGGLLATLLDEAFSRQAVLNLPKMIGVTANLSLNYRAPTRADQFIVIKTKLDELKGRKVRVSGTVEDVNGTVLVDANALIIEPRYASLVNSTLIREVLGQP
ncbi:HotDog domain-containing protein, partial [Vararia minispora EC-137]